MQLKGADSHCILTIVLLSSQVGFSKILKYSVQCTALFQMASRALKSYRSSSPYMYIVNRKISCSLSIFFTAKWAEYSDVLGRYCCLLSTFKSTGLEYRASLTLATYKIYFFQVRS